jgi:histidinol dehydrogenase
MPVVGFRPVPLVRIVTDLAEARRTILRRTPAAEDDAADRVAAGILDDVRRRGDEALREYTERFDRARLERFEVEPAEFDGAQKAVPREVHEALGVAVEQVRAFHQRHLPRSWIDFGPDGATGQRITAIERIGLHAPGGRAAYPSTVVMSAVPALVAGCESVVMCTPPRADGTAHPTMLVAAELAGVHRVFKIGGAQAIGAMAYGTESVPRVDKIVGPGNQYVAAAKRRVYGLVGIDSIAGPTETVVVADESADPGAAAADLLAQAEHDPMATAILLATSLDVAEAVAAQVERQLKRLGRVDVIRESFGRGSGVVVAGSLDAALDLANEYAPEHLCLLVRDPWTALAKVRNAGGVFVGETSLEAVGDYTAGPSHVMPTGGTARFSSPLTTNDFVKITSVFAVSPAGIDRLGPPAVVLAEAEGLTAHAAAVEHRLERIPHG